MTLHEWRQDLERRAAQAEAVGAMAPVANVYRAIVAELATVEANGNGAPAPPSRLLTARVVAERLGCSVRQVYAKADTFPFTVRVGGMVRFSEVGLERFLTGRPR